MIAYNKLVFVVCLTDADETLVAYYIYYEIHYVYLNMVFVTALFYYPSKNKHKALWVSLSYLYSQTFAYKPLLPPV